MAVTQNLARLSDALLAKCAVSVSDLNSVCSFTALDSSDYLDVDWAPRLLQHVMVTANVPADLAAALDRATSGDGEVNRAYRDWPDSIWEHPVTSLKPADVREMDAALGTLASLDPVNEHSVEDTMKRLRVGEVPEQALTYLHKHFSALCDFYRGAATRHLGVVMWRD